MKKNGIFLTRFSFFLVLFLITTSQSVNACDCVSVSGVKANMHTLQTMVETFGVDQRYFPRSVIQLERYARTSANPYWKDFENPTTFQKGYLKSFADYKLYLQPNAAIKEQYLEILGLRFLITEPGIPDKYVGMVLYDFVSKNKYFIYGVNNNGELIQEKGKNFTVSNS